MARKTEPVTCSVNKEIYAEIKRRDISPSIIFKVGAEILLGNGEDLTLLHKKKDEAEKAYVEAKKKFDYYAARIAVMQVQEDERLANKENEDYDLLVSEFKRVAPLLIYNKKIEVITHLSGLNKAPEKRNIKEFFNRSSIPSEDEIIAFVRG